MGKLIEINRPKPKSCAEMVEFARELLIYIYENETEILLIGMKGKEGMEAMGLILEGQTSRSVDRVQDLMEAWVCEWEYEAEDD